MKLLIALAAVCFVGCSSTKTVTVEMPPVPGGGGAFTAEIEVTRKPWFAKEPELTRRPQAVRMVFRHERLKMSYNYMCVNGHLALNYVSLPAPGKPLSVSVLIIEE